MTDPDLTTEVVGYRQWYVTPDLELRSAGYTLGGTWQRGDNTAACGRLKNMGGVLDPSIPNPCGDCPGPQCDCGFYALHDPSDHWYGKRANTSLWFVQEIDTLLSGIIVAWGALQVHHQGFRAQHARIAALALPEMKRDQVVARAVASAYGVPCVPSDELPRIAAEYGGTVPVEYRPDKPKPKRGPYGLFHTGGLYSQWLASPAFTWSSSWTTPLPAPPAPAPRVSREARQRMEFIQGLKKSANRQGPDKPKRAPKKLG